MLCAGQCSGVIIKLPPQHNSATLPHWTPATHSRHHASTRYLFHIYGHGYLTAYQYLHISSPRAFLYKYQLYSRTFDCTLSKMLMALKRPTAMFSLLGPVPPAARMICLWMSIFSRSSQKREITSTSNPSWARRVVWSEDTRAGNEHSQCCTISWLKAARYTTSNIKESTIRDYAKLDRYMILAKMSFQLQRLEAGCWWLWLVCPDCIVSPATWPQCPQLYWSPARASSLASGGRGWPPLSLLSRPGSAIVTN